MINYAELIEETEKTLKITKKSDYYSGRNLLTMKDLNGNDPEIFVSQTLRSFGKTTFYNVMLWEGWIKFKHVFGIQMRHKYEIKGAEDVFISTIQPFYSEKIELETKKYQDGGVVGLFHKGEICGFVFAVRGANSVKKMSNLISSIDHYLTDELIPEDEVYVPGEIAKFKSIHTSIARAPGQQVKKVNVYLLTNRVSYLNPYYIELGITERIKENTRKMRGNNWVFENGLNDKLALKHRESGFNNAFEDDSDLRYITGELAMKSLEMIDIGKMKGDKKYCLTIMYDGEKFGLYRIGQLYYLSKSYDRNFLRVHGVTVEDAIMGGTVQCDVKFYRNLFNYGFFRFENAKCKKVGLAFLKAM